jgi:hypothetical protein
MILGTVGQSIIDLMPLRSGASTSHHRLIMALLLVWNHLDIVLMVCAETSKTKVIDIGNKYRH